MGVRDRLRSVVRRLRGSTDAKNGRAPSTFMRVSYLSPRQVVLVTTRHDDAQNVWPMDWHIPLSEDPELYGIAITSTSYGAELIRASQVFVVNFVPATWEDVIFFCGRTSGREVDKFEAVALATGKAEAIDAPYLVDALGRLECRVEREVPAGDHTFFVGRVLHSLYRADAPRLHHLDAGVADLAESYE